MNTIAQHRWFLPVLTAAVALWWLPAQAQPPQPYDLTTVVREALRSHPTLQSAGAQVTEAQARLQQAKAGYRPNLGLSLGYTQLQERPSFTVTPFGTLVFGEKDNRQAALSLRVPLYTGGKLAGTNRQARTGVQSSQSALARQRQQIAANAALAYYNVFKARGSVQVAVDQLKTLQSQRDDIARMRERGVATQIDLLRAETAVSSAQEGLTRARNGESIAIAALANTMGLSAETPLNVIEAGTPEGSPLPADAKAAVAESLQQRPELRQIEAAERAAQAGVQVARSGRRPEIGAFAQYDVERPTYMPRTGDWSAGMVLTLNIFNGGATAAQVQQAKAQVTQAQAATMELRNGISLQVTTAFLNLLSARERLTTTEKAVATAQEGARLIQLGYQNGVNTMTDYLTAQSELTRARNDRVTALFDVRAAETELRLALGREP